MHSNVHPYIYFMLLRTLKHSCAYVEIQSLTISGLANTHLVCLQQTKRHEAYTTPLYITPIYNMPLALPYKPNV